jgi:hypothetical protein
MLAISRRRSGSIDPNRDGSVRPCPRSPRRPGSLARRTASAAIVVFLVFAPTALIAVALAVVLASVAPVAVALAAVTFVAVTLIAVTLIAVVLVAVALAAVTLIGVALVPVALIAVILAAVPVAVPLLEPRSNSSRLLM